MTLRPLEHLNAASKGYPDAWTYVTQFRQDLGNGLPDCPDWCFMPMAAWYAIVSADARIPYSRKHDGQPYVRLPMHLIADVARLAALGTWRYSQGIYRYDTDAAEALADTVLHGEMPVDVMLRLPEWSVYIETPGRDWFGDTLYGYWAHLEWDANTHRRELRLLLDCESELIPQILHMGPWTVTEAIDRWFSEAERQAMTLRLPIREVPDGTETGTVIELLSAAINPLLSMLLYLCSDEPDIGSRDYPNEQPGRPRPKKTKRGWRLFAPDKPKVWTVGAEIGETLRQAKLSEPSCRRLRPHLRRAHWHGFWTGPKAGERQFRYKWLPPIVVAGGGDR
jgi:hypothetical protein